MHFDVFGLDELPLVVGKDWLVEVVFSPEQAEFLVALVVVVGQREWLPLAW